MRRIIIFFFIILFMSTCSKKEVEFSEDCEVDFRFINNYLKDVNQVVGFYIDKENNVDQAFKSFINLEVLVSGEVNLDSLGVIFFDSSDVQNDLFEYYNKWIIWLRSNKCFTLTDANRTFLNVNKLYPPHDYSDPEVLRKLRMKNSNTLKDLDISDSQRDSIMIKKAMQIDAMYDVGW